MEAARGDAAAHRWRLLLLACAAGFLWALLTVFGQATSASAADGDDSGSGLLGLVGGTVNAVGDAAGGVVGAVDDAAQATVAVVAPVVTPVVAPVVEAVPEPVKAPVAKLASGTVKTVAATAAAADTLVVSTVQGLADTVTGVAEGTPLAPVVGSVGELDPLLPEVGAIGVVDDVVDTVVGTPAQPGVPVIPVIPGDTVAPGVPVSPGILNPSLVAASLTAPDVVTAAWNAVGAIAQTAQASALESLRLALVAPFSGALPGTAGIGGSLTLAAGALAALMAAWPRMPLLVRARSGPSDERVPSTPVYDTDHSPD